VLDAAADPNTKQEAAFSRGFSKAALDKPIFERDRTQESSHTPTGRSSRVSLGGRNSKLALAVASR